MEKTEAQRWVEVAGKLLEVRDLLGSRRFAKRAQETDPQVDGVDQIIAIIDVLLASEKRINNHLDWYAILQLDRRSNDLELIKRQFKKLALLLHPDKNKSPFSDNAFKLVCDAWAFLSDPSKKSLYDNEFNLFMKFDPIVLKNQQQEAAAAAPSKSKSVQQRRSVREKKKTAKAVAVAAEEAVDEERVQVEKETQQNRLSTFWTVCPYCYHLYEYPRVYEDCCLRCQICRRGFHGAVIPSPPPQVGPGKDWYYCSWAFFPIGFTMPGNSEKNSSWTPFASMFSVPSQPVEVEKEKRKGDDLVDNRSGKKVKTGNVVNNDSTNKSCQTEKATEGNGNKFEGGNVVNKTVQDGVGANNVEPQKTVRIKTTARKSIRPKLNNQKTSEPQNKIIGEKPAPEWAGMDLNLEVKAEAEEPKKPCAVEGVVGSIDKEATEGIGFFEGLDDILGNLPMLSVPGDKKAQSAS